MRADTWTLNCRITAAERDADEADGLAYQRSPTPDTLQKYQTSSITLVELQKCAYTGVWHKFTNSINHQTSAHSMWKLINKVVRKKSVTVLHHSPAQYAQDVIDAWSEQSSVDIFHRACRRLY